jgi:hypothetical protein
MSKEVLCVKILPDENEFAVNKIYGLKSVAVMIIALLLASYGLIGGCNNNGSTQMADALQIGELSGPIVPAVDAEFFIRDWQEGDSNNNFFLQGSMAGKLTQAEQDALRSAYKSGFYIALIHPTVAEIYDLDDVLGLEQIIVDNGPLDIFAVKRELVGGGIRRYFTLPNKQQNLEPRDLSIERERVTALMNWHNMQAPLLGQELMN